eukprot:3955144-Amphidinium_carterae.1
MQLKSIKKDNSKAGYHPANMSTSVFAASPSGFTGGTFMVRWGSEAGNRSSGESDNLDLKFCKGKLYSNLFPSDSNMLEYRKEKTLE